MKYPFLLDVKKYFFHSLCGFILVIQACFLTPHSDASNFSGTTGITSSSEPLVLSFFVNGYSLQAEMQENTQLLEKITTPINLIEQKHYKGVFSGYPNSSLRVSYSRSNNNGHWRGVLLFQKELYVVNTSVNASVNTMRSSTVGIPAYRPSSRLQAHKTCASGKVNKSSPFTAGGINRIESHPSSSAFNIQNLISAPATVADVCANAINGVCLLPEIELAYDLSYQNLPGSETPMQRALRELNEMELFFQDGLGYQFSRISLTMLNSAQDNLIGHSDDPNDLLDRIRILRGSNQLGFLQQSRSIFHLVTGRDFSGVDADVIGIAYLGQVCESFGLNTGLTDAGDTSLVSLVMAHEIGHNLGAEHDAIADNGCPENRNVMSASLGFQASGFTGFSSCSIDTINQTVADNLSGLCFNFPIDLGLTASLDNPVSPDRVSPFDLIYSVSADDGYIPIAVVDIQGVIVDSAEGQFMNAEVEGGNCVITASTYQCTVNNPDSGFLLTITARASANAEALTMQHSVSTATADTTDVLPSNNTLNVRLHSFGESADLNNNIDEPENEAEEVQPEPNNTSSSDDSSGGGGATHPLGLLMLIFMSVVKSLNLRFRVYFNHSTN